MVGMTTTISITATITTTTLTLTIGMIIRIITMMRGAAVTINMIAVAIITTTNVATTVQVGTEIRKQIAFTMRMD